MHGDPGLLGIVTSIGSSPTFWEETVPLACGALGCLAAIGAVATRVWSARPGGRGLKDLAGNTEASAEAVDFVLTFPFLLLFAMLFAEFMLAAHGSLIVHYAAYSAARSARAAYWARSPAQIALLQFQSRFVGDSAASSVLGWLALLQLNAPEAGRRANIAARIALMSAVPSSISGVTTSAPSEGTIPATLASSLGGSQTAAVKKAAYVFTAANVSVSVAPTPIYYLAALRSLNGGPRVDALPITATVSFRYPLTLPVARFFGTPGANGYWRRLTAKVQVL